MIQIHFKNLEKSEIAREAVIQRLEPFLEKFRHLKNSKIRVTLEMENAPHQPGPDMFTVKVHILGGRYRGITITKSDRNLYIALAEVVEHLLERLNRHGDRARIKNRSQSRQWTNKLKLSLYS